MKVTTRVAVVTAVAGLLIPGPAAGACATSHMALRWITFQPPVNDFGPVFFYSAVEPATTTNVPVTIQGIGDDCSTPPQSVVGTYQVSDYPPGTPRAANAADYTPIFPARTTGPLCGYHPYPECGGQQQHQDTVSILSDSVPENVVEQAQALIASSTMSRSVPFDVPLYIIDDDGLDRVSFASAGPYERSETYGSITVPVFRAGPAAGAATYALKAGGSSANPATPGDDYPPPASVSFDGGERVKLITIQINDDGKSEQPEELTLTLTDPGTVLPDDPVTTTVRILDSVGASGLQSRLHHPRQGWDYRASDFRIREVHIFTLAGEGAPVTAAQFALRRNMKGGECDWWNGKRFKKGECGNERWLGTGEYQPDFFYIRLDELAPSKGKIKNYTGFSRARSQTGELEGFLERGRNYNTFEVKPGADGRSG